MVENTLYLATEEVAKRAGVYEVAYVVKDGRFVVDTMELRRIRMTGSEYLTGINGIEQISKVEAQALISENGYKRISDLLPKEEVEEPVVSEESPSEEPEEQEQEELVEQEPAEKEPEEEETEEESHEENENEQTTEE